MGLRERIAAAVARSSGWVEDDTDAAVGAVLAAPPAELAEAIGGTVEEGLTPTTAGMVRVVGPWVKP